jgi:hypothetical protein
MNAKSHGEIMHGPGTWDNHSLGMPYNPTAEVLEYRHHGA